MKKIVQIGANKGNDDLSQIIKNDQPEILILVEPMFLHNDNLKSHYSWVNNLYIENLIISDVKSNNVDFYYHLDDGPGFEVASVDINHITKHYPNTVDKIVKTSLESITINELFEKHNLSKIDILFIDAEGIDDIIIRSINFSKVEVNQIYFENLHIKDFGVYDYLKSIGYKLTMKTGSHGWCSLAEKINN
jgi:FkbM family methyltransferase